MFIRRMACASALAAAMGPWCTALAQDTLTEAAAIGRALAREGIAARDEAERAIGAADIAAVRPLDNPAAEVVRESAGGEAEWQLRVTQPVDLSGRRGSLRSAARAEAEAIDSDIERRRHELIAETRLAYVRCARAGAELGIWSAHIAQIAEAERIAAARASAGDTAVYDLRRVRVEARAADAQHLLADGERRASCAALASLTGVNNPAIAPAAMTSLSTDIAAGTRPDLNAREQRVLAASQRVRAATQARLPQFTIGAGAKHVSDGNDSAIGPILSLSVSLPIFDRGGPTIAAARAREQALLAELSIVRRRVEAEQEAAAARAVATRNAAVAAERARDDASRLGRTAETAYQAGEIGVVELLDAYEAAREAELSVIDLAAQAAEASINFDLAAGKAVP